MIKPKKDLQAIHTHDLDKLLENLNLLGEFKSGKLKCHFCRDIISKDNFGAVFVKNEDILLTCSKLECLTQIEQK